MWQVINKSSGISVYSNGDKRQCAHWFLLNNFDEDGNDLGLYTLRKASAKPLEAPTRPSKPLVNTDVVSQ